MEGSISVTPEKGLPRVSARQALGWRLGMASSGDEFVPLADHVVVLVHDSVPAGDTTHAVVIRAAVAGRAGLFQHGAIGCLDVAYSGLAFHPVAPLVGRHVGLGGGE